MTTRITRKDAEQTLRVYCERAGLPYGHYVRKKDIDGAPTMEVEQCGRTYVAHLLGGHAYVLTGGLALDCAYGGYQVQRIIGADARYTSTGGPSTGITTPFGGGYRTAREVVAMLEGAIAGLELAGR